MTAETTTAPAPGSTEWLRYMTASKIAAVVGTSPYESRFSLWHRMAGHLEKQPERPEMTYGNYLEPVLLRWFADQHPEFSVRPGAWFADGRHGATPDGTALLECGDPTEDLYLVQCKTARQAWEWANGVPPGYYDQVQWEMHVTGTHVCYIAADIAMEFREFRVERDEERITFLVAEADKFLASLDEGRPPAIDDSIHTYLAIRELHPDIDDVDYEVPARLARRWLKAKARVEFWEKAERKARSLIADAMSTARRAVVGETPLLTRQARGGGTPFAKASNNLPHFEEIPHVR